MDQSSFEQMYLAMLPGLYRLAQSILRNRADAQDAVQQAALNAWRAIDGIRQGTERAYFTRIVINECRNIQRARMKMAPMDVLPEPAFLPDDSGLRDAIDGLPEKLRLPFLLRFMEGYTDKEAAIALRISLSAFKSRLLRARRRLQTTLKEEEIP